MKITKMIVNNFKALSGEHIIETDNPMICLVGENNTGKTTLFTAIDFLKSGAAKGKSIDDYKNKNHIDKDVSVEIIMQGNIRQIIQDFSDAKKYLSYVYDDNSVETIRLKRSSLEAEITQNAKQVKLNAQKITVFNYETQQFENPSGFDAAIGSLFETQFVWSDIQASDVVDFAPTKMLGKLLKEISKDFETSSEWRSFQEAHQKAFLDGDNSLSKKSDALIRDIQSSLGSFYGNASVKFDFQAPDPSTLIKIGDVFVDDGIDTSIAEKGSGMQRAFALSVIKVYADYLSRHESDSTLKKPLFFFIDEPEISLHPKAQAILNEALKKIAKHQQVFVTTHSPYFLKHFGIDEKAVKIVSRDTSGNVSIEPSSIMNTFGFSPTLAEINYFAYNLTTEDFHNELYGYITEVTKNFSYKKLDDWLLQSCQINKNKQWLRFDKGQLATTPEDVSLMTFIRHSIHHPENTHNQKYNEAELKASIEAMLSIVRSQTFQALI